MTASAEAGISFGLRSQRTRSDTGGELRLLDPLLEWLRRTRRINADTRVAFELAWFGRRVDLATLTTTRRAVAYELKLGGLRRALEQASYNRLAFDRSYIVTASVPRSENIALAAEHGIGLIVVRDGEILHLLDSPLQSPTPEVRARLLNQLRVAHLLDRV
jgi:hypothetical protein